MSKHRSGHSSILSRKSMSRAFFALAAAIAIAVVSVAGCGEDNYVVGGKCATGFTQCGNACVDTQSDPENCGACSNACNSGTACGAGVCGGPTDATMDVGDVRVNDGGDGGDGGDGSPFDGPIEEGGRRDGGDGGEGGTGEGGTGEGGTGDGGDGGGVCTPPFNTPAHCGDCFTQCIAPNDVCKPSDGGFACGPLCDPPLTNCGGVCLDLRSDPFNCGMCGKICPTFLCQMSTCVNGFNGEFVLIGHDFASNVPNPGSQVKVLTNSVFLRPSNPLRILAYQRYASAAAVTRVTSILQAYATSISRAITITTTIVDSDIPTKLNVSDFDGLLIYDQATAPAGALATLGSSWASTFATYLPAGGLVIALDGLGGSVLDGGAVSEMPQLITSAGILNVTAHATLPQGTTVNNLAPGDSVGSNVGAFYGTTLDSARFVTDAPSASVTYVIFDQPDSQPVVVHKTF